MEVTFRKQVARKGSSDAGRLSQLLDELEAVLPYADPMAELTASLGSPLSLAALLDVRDALQGRADLVYDQARRTSQVVNRCLDLPPSPTRGLPPGF